MKSIKNLEKSYIIARCVIFCMLIQIFAPIMSYAESADARLSVDGITRILSVQPYENDLGIMIGACELVEALQLEYDIDTENKSFSIISEEHGNVVFMHTATSYCKSGDIYECPPVFYIENTIPMIELGFFCDLFEMEYSYDKESNTIFISKNDIQLLSTSSTSTISGKLYYEGGVKEKGLSVNLIMHTVGLDIYGNTYNGPSCKLGTVSLNQGDTEKSYSYDYDKSYPYYYLSYSIPETFKYGYVSKQGTVQTQTNEIDREKAKRFNSNCTYDVNIYLDTSPASGSVTGDVSLINNSALPADGLDVKLFLKKAKKVRESVYIYGKGMQWRTYWQSGELNEFGTMHLDASSNASFSYDLRQFQTDINYPYYFVMYEFADPNADYLPRGYYNNNGGITYFSGDIDDFELGLSNSYTFGGKMLCLKDDMSISLTIPEMASSPFGDLGENAQWSFDVASGTLTISGSGAISCSGNPPWLEFESYIKKLVIDPGITDIGECRFGNLYNLTSVVIPDSVKSITGNMFNYCDSLEEVHITDIGAWCNISFNSAYTNPLYCAENLYCCNELVTNLEIPEGTSHIENYAFYNCDSLENVRIPDSVTRIGSYSFYNCSNLENLTIGRGVTDIDTAAFVDCNNLSVNILDLSAFLNISYGKYSPGSASAWGYRSNPLYWANKLYINGELVTSLAIPEGTTEIKAGAFYGCKCITDVILPDSITKIEEQAFSECELDGVYISDLVSFFNISFMPYSTSFGINYSSNPLYMANKLYINGEPATSLIIPEGTMEIKAGALYGYSGLTSVTIPDSVATIGDYAFYDCDSLTSITIPDSVTSIGDYAFYNCSLLKSVIIPDSVTSIGDCAFYNCSRLETIFYTGTEEKFSNICLTLDSNYSLTSANIIYFDGMNAVINSATCVYADNKVSATINFNSLRSGTLYLAIYDGGNLVAIKGTAAALGETEKTIEIENVDESYIGCDAKVFYWKNGEALLPLAKTFESKVTEYIPVL